VAIVQVLSHGDFLRSNCRGRQFDRECVPEKLLDQLVEVGIMLDEWGQLNNK
jgi:hypothetical protein